MPESIIQKIQGYLSTQPVDKAWLFGSYARNEYTPDSDVDILVRYTDSDSLSLLDICRISVGLEKMINKKVDLVEEGCLMPFAENSVNKDKILIYERTA
ncbi:MAG: nucleotidyltransferase domain-containing protein [Bacteroidaceae bacterium]|nr:nucleotidyltransferase domain-containing protein [Bacteroidaceae bacterium]